MARGLAAGLQSIWRQQVSSGFILGDPYATTETRTAYDESTGVGFRFRWLPHRELRTDTAELERRGILNPDYGEAELFRDPRDATGRHCFLCPGNVAVCHPMEALVPVVAGGRAWLAGANFAWLARDHFTLMSEQHEDQIYSRDVLEAMLEINAQTNGVFRAVFNGAGAGATIPWHLHLHLSSDPMPIERLRPGTESDYPIPVAVFRMPGAIDRAHDHVVAWEAVDPENHRVNLLVATVAAEPTVFVVLRDARQTIATNKGLMGGWEVAGDFAYSEPGMRREFEAASLATVREALSQIRPAVPHPLVG